MATKNDDSYPSKLSKDLSTLMSHGTDQKRTDDDAMPPRGDLIVVTASCPIADGELYETTVCTPDVPADAVAEAVIGLMEQIRTSGIDVLKQEITLSFGRAADL
jgi:hypothetical protein